MLGSGAADAVGCARNPVPLGKTEHMKKTVFKIAGLLGLALTVVLSIAGSPKKETRATGKTSIYDFQLKTLEGQEISLAKFKGKKMLLVNTASECGYTPQ